MLLPCCGGGRRQRLRRGLHRRLRLWRGGARGLRLRLRVHRERGQAAVLGRVPSVGGRAGASGGGLADLGDELELGRRVEVEHAREGEGLVGDELLHAEGLADLVPVALAHALVP